MMKKTMRALIGPIVVMMLLDLGCGHEASKGGARDVRLTSGNEGTPEGAPTRAVSQAELQEDLQRFTGQLLDRLAQATSEDEADAVRDRASDETLRLSLTYMASALDIATGPLPEIGVLDMLVLLRLGRETLTAYSIPEVLGERGRPLAEAMERSEEQLWPIADKIMTPEQKKLLIARIDAWRRDNPDQHRVAGVRLTDFSARAGEVEEARADEMGGLLSSVKGATAAADEALLLAKRGLFLVNRMPFLLRMQMRLGTREVMGDTLARLSALEPAVRGLGDLGPMMARMTTLLRGGIEVTREARLLIGEAKPLLPSQEELARIQHLVDTTNELTLRASVLVGDVRASVKDVGPDPIANVTRRVDTTLARALGYLVALGAAWSALFWGGYVLAKRALRRRRRSKERSRGTPSSGHVEPAVAGP